MDIPSFIDSDAWNGFVEMRIRIKKPLTERAMKIAIRKLEQLLKEGHDPTEVLDQSTFNNWQGLFPVRRDDGQVRRSDETSSRRSGGGYKSFTEQREERQLQRLRDGSRTDNFPTRDVYRQGTYKTGEVVMEKQDSSISAMEDPQDLRLQRRA